MKHKPLPPLEVLQENFKYIPSTGALISHKTGEVLQTLDSKSQYYVVGFQDKDWQAHRFCFYLGTKFDPRDFQIDHIDGNKTNNKLNNLRLATNGLNQYNSKLRITNRSGRKGVSYDKKSKKWRSSITVNGKRVPLYYGDSWDEAVREREKAESSIHSEWHF